jgi:hypothetical protein
LSFFIFNTVLLHLDALNFTLVVCRSAATRYTV